MTEGRGYWYPQPAVIGHPLSSDPDGTRPLTTQHHHDDHCLFCKIIQGLIPASVVLETDDAIAFLDIHPVIKGHTLLLPKPHHAHLADLPGPLAASTAALLPKLCRAVQNATGADAYNVIINNGRAAGQTIDHGHWHIIPRFPSDPVNWPWPHTDYVGDELAQIQFAMKRELRANKDQD